MKINNVMVVGAGQMGAGIAQVFVQAGFDVLLFDINKQALDKGLGRISKLFDRAVEKEKITRKEADQALKRLRGTQELDDVKDRDLVIEAIIEKIEAKVGVFQQLDQLAPPHAILATNTSSLSITEIAASTNRPDQVIGMHFMNPVPVMKLVEIIRGLQTNDQAFKAVETVAGTLGKQPVEVQDYPGFASNRILMPMINEAIFAVYEGVASPEDIDSVMKLGMNHPMGPLALADFIGLDTCLYIMEVLHEGFGDSKYRPCPLLKNYVKAGWLGKKSGRGFYIYET